jgi:hypothetical protein
MELILTSGIASLGVLAAEFYEHLCTLRATARRTPSLRQVPPATESAAPLARAA